MKKELVAKYEQLTGKKNGKFFDEEALSVLIAHYEKNQGITTSQVVEIKTENPNLFQIEVEPEKKFEDMTEEEKREATLLEINGQTDTDVIVPVYQDGKTFGIINNKYVPWLEAEVYILERKLKRLIRQYLKVKKQNLGC